MAELRARASSRWTFHPDGVLATWVAEMDFELAPPVADALHTAGSRADTGSHYPALERSTAEAASGFWEDPFGWKVDPDRVIAAPDVVEGIRRVISS